MQQKHATIAPAELEHVDCRNRARKNDYENNKDNDKYG